MNKLTCRNQLIFSRKVPGRGRRLHQMSLASLIGVKYVRLAEVLKLVALVNSIVPIIRRVAVIKLEKVALISALYSRACFQEALGLR